MNRFTVPSLLALLVVATAVSDVVAQNAPNPGSQGSWSTPTTDPFTDSGFENYDWTDVPVWTKYKGTRTTRSRSVDICTQIGIAYCGGSSTVQAGITIELSYGGVSLGGELSQAWTSPAADPCHLCATFACKSATEVETTEKGQKKPGWIWGWEDYGPVTSTKLSNVSGFRLMQNCDKSDAAKQKCCPGTTGSSSNAVISSWPIPPGFLDLLFHRRGMCSGGLGSRFDFTDLGAWIKIQLPLEDSGTTNPFGLPVYHANSIDELSLNEKLAIKRMVSVQLDPNNIGELPFGHVVLTVVNADGTYTNIDLGENDEMNKDDLFRTAHGSDIDLDGVVTEHDLEIVLQDMSSAFWHPRGDVNLDGVANEEDLMVVSGNLEH